MQKPSGAKTYAFWSLVGFLCLIAWANMILTVVIFSVLRLGQSMESMELVPEEGVVKFFGESDLDKLYKPDGKIEGFVDLETTIKGIKSSVMLEVEDDRGRIRNSLTLDQNGTLAKGINSFKVGQIFSAESPNFLLKNGGRNIQAKLANVGRISSPLNEKLIIKSDAFAKLKGSEGTRIEGKEILWSADQQVKLKSVNGSIILNSKSGLTLDVKSIPIVSKNNSTVPLASQYKICVCMPQGKLFRVPVSNDHTSHVACHNIDVTPDYNPCM
ncbi:hypothetical protein O3M35_006354 [Rhynocoris fuscipes]|uniref:Beta-sarcoglycan n=1 Tax=Rhynocoris fuscipes TaxID=488301 RepID=A0AAW1DFK8_9HEMI